MKIALGSKVRVCFGSGLDSDLEGTVVSPSWIKTNGRGIPLLPGHYKPVDWSREVAVMTPSGRLFTMFTNRLTLMS